MNHDEVDDLSELRVQLAPLSDNEIEALIRRADTLYALYGYQDVLGERWNANEFATEADRTRCWTLRLLCIERVKAMQRIVGYGPVDIRQKVQL